MWFWIIIIVGLLSSLRKLLIRSVLKENGDSIAYSFIQQAMAAILMIPVFLFSLRLPDNILPFLLLILTGIWDTLSTFLTAESYRFLDVSLRTIVNQTRIIWVPMLAALFLAEEFTTAKFVGVLLIFIGIVFATFRRERVNRMKSLWLRFKNGKNTDKEKGIILTLSSAFITSFEILMFKHLLSFFSPSFMVFGIGGVSALLFALLSKDLKPRLLKFSQGKNRLVFLTGFLGAITFFLFFVATSMTEVGKTLPVVQSFTVLTILGGVVFLKEKERLWQKIFGGILTILGVILVKGS